MHPGHLTETELTDLRWHWGDAYEISEAAGGPVSGPDHPGVVLGELGRRASAYGLTRMIMSSQRG